MKILVLVGEGLADEPLDDLSGRTPLEAAKIPAMNALAEKGMVGRAGLVPLGLPLGPDVACLSALGFDPKQHYTGIAPLDAAAFGIAQTDAQVAFRCDFITAVDETLVDATAGKISASESKFLVEELNRRMGRPGVTIYAGDGYKNILIVNDAELAGELEKVECAPPSGLVGEKYSKHLPRGKGAELLAEWMAKSTEILENHEINRVRIDLKENPANRVWLWGQGRKPKLPAFEMRPGGGCVVAEATFAAGLGALLGMEKTKDLKAAAQKEFVFIYKEASADGKPVRELKDKIRWVEEFDALVGSTVKALKAAGPFRVLVTSDFPRDYGHVPFLISGEGISADASTGPFNEKTASQSAHSFDEGWRLMDFLKRGAAKK